MGANLYKDNLAREVGDMSTGMYLAAMRSRAAAAMASAATDRRRLVVRKERGFPELFLLMHGLVEQL